MEFKDSIVVVTGGTRGIGRGISLAFASQGANVFAAYLANDQAARQLESDAAGLPGSITTVRADVSNSEDVQRLMNCASATGGYIDVLVNNAGVIKDCYLMMMPDDDWDTVINSNLRSLFHCCKWGVRKMMARRSGSIVNISSISALIGTAGQSNYAASKGGMISLTRSLAREVGGMGIRVNAVTAGMIDTEMTAALKQEIVERIVKSSALGRIGSVADVADAVLFLSSGRASYITGQSLVVDGGIA